MPLKKYKINYELTQHTEKNRYFVTPKSDEELKAKYGDDFESVWNNPQTTDHFLDIFGEEIFYMYDKDIKEKFGEDVLDNFFALVDSPDYEAPTFPTLDSMIQEEKHLDDSDDEIVLDTSDDEISVGESESELDVSDIRKTFHATEEEAIHGSLPKEEVKEPDDGEIADYVEYDTVDKLTQQMTVGYTRGYVPNGSNLPANFTIVGNKNTLHDALHNYADANHIEYNFTNVRGYGYTAVKGPYVKGRFVDEDEKRLNAGVTALNAMKEKHATHGIGYMFKHPINYFREWKAIHNIDKTLKKVGFTQAEIDAKTNELEGGVSVESENKTVSLRNQLSNEFSKENSLNNSLNNEITNEKVSNKSKDDIELDI